MDNDRFFNNKHKISIDQNHDSVIESIMDQNIPIEKILIPEIFDIKFILNFHLKILNITRDSFIDEITDEQKSGLSLLEEMISNPNIDPTRIVEIDLLQTSEPYLYFFSAAVNNSIRERIDVFRDTIIASGYKRLNPDDSLLTVTEKLKTTRKTLMMRYRLTLIEMIIDNYPEETKHHLWVKDSMLIKTLLFF